MLRPSWLWGGHQRAGWKGPSGSGKGRVQSSTFRHVPDRWEGWARQSARSSSCGQMVRIFLEYPAGWPAGPQIHRYTGGSSGIQVEQLERTWYSNPWEERGRAERREASGSPHASFNSGISAERRGGKNCGHLRRPSVLLHLRDPTQPHLKK